MRRSADRIRGYINWSRGGHLWFWHGFVNKLFSASSPSIDRTAFHIVKNNAIKPSLPGRSWCMRKLGSLYLSKRGNWGSTLRKPFLAGIKIPTPDQRYMPSFQLNKAHFQVLIWIFLTWSSIGILHQMKTYFTLYLPLVSLPLNRCFLVSQHFFWYHFFWASASRRWQCLLDSNWIEIILRQSFARIETRPGWTAKASVTWWRSSSKWKKKKASRSGKTRSSWCRTQQCQKVSWFSLEANWRL